MGIVEIVAIVRDVIVCATAITGAVVAVKGLTTWRRQHKGQADYELARRLLTTLFRYRDAINGVRNPAMFAHEMPMPPPDEAAQMSPAKIRFHGLSKAYQARWDRVNVESSKLYPDLIESEALWGDELKKLFRVLKEREYELLLVVQDHLERSNPDADPELRSEKRHDEFKILYGSNKLDGRDEYDASLKTAIEAIEKYLKPKLGYR